MTAYGISGRGVMSKPRVDGQDEGHATHCDLSGVQVGDYVTVRLRVLKIGQEALNVGSLGGGIGTWVYPEDVVGHEKRDFHVGDRVKVSSEEGVFEIEGKSARSDVYFCTRTAPLRHLVCHPSVLERVA